MNPGSSNRPITDPREIQAFLRELPMNLGPGFADFVTGFPRRYLAATPRQEIVRHFALMRSLGSRAVVSSLAREERLWRLCLVARDRSCLFSRIAGALSCFGMNIVSAEAFANANAFVLDTFHFSDRDGIFAEDGQRKTFQSFLEDAVEGKVKLEPLVRPRLAQAPVPEAGSLAVELENDPALGATRLTLRSRDRFALLYLVSRCLSAEGCNIDLAHIETPDDRVCDEFYISREGGPLAPEAQRRLTEKLTSLGERYTRQDPTLLDDPER